MHTLFVYYYFPHSTYSLRLAIKTYTKWAWEWESIIEIILNKTIVTIVPGQSWIRRYGTQSVTSSSKMGHTEQLKRLLWYSEVICTELNF